MREAVVVAAVLGEAVEVAQVVLLAALVRGDGGERDAFAEPQAVAPGRLPAADEVAGRLVDGAGAPLRRIAAGLAGFLVVVGLAAGAAGADRQQAVEGAPARRRERELAAQQRLLRPREIPVAVRLVGDEAVVVLEAACEAEGEGLRQRPAAGDGVLAAVALGADHPRAQLPRTRRLAGIHHHRAGQRVAPLAGGLRTAQHLDLIDIEQVFQRTLLRGLVERDAIDLDADQWRADGAVGAGLRDAADREVALLLRAGVGRAAQQLAERAVTLVLDVPAAEDTDRAGGLAQPAAELLALDHDGVELHGVGALLGAGRGLFRRRQGLHRDAAGRIRSSFARLRAGRKTRQQQEDAEQASAGQAAARHVPDLERGLKGLSL